MVSWMLQRRLTQTSTRLKELRAELAQVDEQFDVVSFEAEDQELRAMVSETPGAASEARDARKHADAMARHRTHIKTKIQELERRQDELLDKLTAE